VTELAFTDQLGVPLLLALFLLKPLATSGCLGSGAPGGLFTPSVTIGAAFGGFCGHLWSRLWPGATAGSYAVIGAGAVLAATTQAPISSIVLLLELTHHTLGIIVPILCAVIGAAITSRLLDRRSLYSGPVAPLRLPVPLPADHPPIAYQASISADFAIVSLATSYQTLVQRLLDLDPARQILYVLDEKGGFAGRILPADVMACDPLSRALNTGAAADVVTPVTCLLATMTPANVQRLLERESTGELPVVDAPGGALLGVVRRNA